MSFYNHTRYGRTRQPKQPRGLDFSENLTGNQKYVLPYADFVELGDNWDRANVDPALGLVTENQRYIHVLIDSSTMDNHGNKNLNLGILGYINAFGFWANLYYPDKDGTNQSWAPNWAHVNGKLGEGTSGYHILEILGVDKVLFYHGNSNADEAPQEQIIRVAFSTF